MAQVEALEAYEEKQKLIESNQVDFIKNLIPQLKAQAEYLDLASRSGHQINIGGGEFVTPNRAKAISAFKSAMALYFEGITGDDIDRARVISELQDQITKSTLGVSDAMGNGAQEAAIFRKEIQDLINKLTEFSKQEDKLSNKKEYGKSKKYEDLTDEIKRIQSELMGLKEQFDELMSGSTPEVAKLAQYRTRLENVFGPNFSNEMLTKFMEESQIVNKHIEDNPITVEIQAKFNEKEFDQSLIALTKSAADKYQIPQEIFLRQIRRESYLNTSAKSSVGALGLGQLMPGTARDLGLTVTKELDERLDAAKNLEASAKYLKQMYAMFGSWELALAAYNAGPGNVKKAGGIPSFKETIGYVKYILAEIPDEIAKAQNLISGEGLQDKILDVARNNKKVMQDIVTWLLTGKSIREEEVKLQEKLVDKQYDYANALRDSNDAFEKLKINMGLITESEYFEQLKSTFSGKRTEFDNITERIDLLVGTIPLIKDRSEQLNAEIHLNELYRDRIKIFTDLQNTIESMANLSSRNLGQAFLNQFQILRQESERFADQFASDIIGATKDLTKNILSEVFSGEKRRKFDEDIESARYDLEQIRAKKTQIDDASRDILIVEDEEYNTLLKINKLEEERGNILKNIVLDTLQKIQDKLIDMAINNLLAMLAPKESPYQKWIDDLTKVNQLLMGIGGASSLINPSLPFGVPYEDVPAGNYGDVGRSFAVRPSPSAEMDRESLGSRMTKSSVTNSSVSTSSVNIVFNGPIYGEKEFAKQVDKAQRELKRSRR